MAEIADRTGTTVSVVRRLVGKVDHEAHRQRQEEIARQIDQEPLSWPEKVERWTQQTGQCGVTFWRVLKRCRR